MTPAFIEAVLGDRREEAAMLLDVLLPDEFPREGERRFLKFRLGQMRADERFETWCPNVVVLDDRMIGHAGYHGPPGQNSAQDPGRRRVRLHDLPGGRGNGYAMQAAVMLMDLAMAGRDPPLRARSRAGQRAVTCDRPQARLRQDGEHMDEEDGLEHVRASALGRLARAELRDPRQPAQPEPERREQEVEEQPRDPEEGSTTVPSATRAPAGLAPQPPTRYDAARPFAGAVRRPGSLAPPSPRSKAPRSRSPGSRAACGASPRLEFVVDLRQPDSAGCCRRAAWHGRCGSRRAAPRRSSGPRPSWDRRGKRGRLDPLHHRDVRGAVAEVAEIDRERRLRSARDADEDDVRILQLS